MSSNEKGSNYSGFGYKSPFTSRGYFAFPISIKNTNKIKDDEKRERIKDEEEFYLDRQDKIESGDSLC